MNRTQRLAAEVLKHLNFPILENTPCVAIDFDDTLAEYGGWKGPLHVGIPRENAVWALKCFKHNKWEVEIFTSRSLTEPLWKWVETYAPGTVVRINDTRPAHPHDVPGRESQKPKVDLFIDDRTPEFIGEDLNWVKIMEGLDEKGFFPEGLLPLE